MKRPPLVLAFACLAAFDVLLVAGGLAIVLRPTAKRAPLAAVGPAPGVNAAGSSARAIRTLPASARTSVAAQGYRPRLPAFYSAALPARTIAGWVFEQQQDEWKPIADVVVRVWRGRKFDLHGEGSVEPPLYLALSKPDGSFEFGGLEPGDYTLCVDKRGCSGRTAFCPVAAEASAERHPGWKFVFGTARIEGTVFDLDGSTLPGIGFAASPEHSDGWCLAAEGATDEGGGFVLSGLPSDEYVLNIGSAPAERFAWPRQRISFALAQGETREIDVGSGVAPVHVTGRLRDAQGNAVRAAGLHLEFETAQVGVDGAAHVAIDAPVADSGAFETRLPAGSWTPRLRGATGEALELAAQPVSGESCFLDLVVRGARVGGLVFERGARTPLDGSQRHAQVGICRPGAPGANVLHTSAVDAQGRYAIDFVEPGEWELRVGPEWAAKQDEPLKFTLAPGEGDKQVDVPVRNP